MLNTIKEEDNMALKKKPVTGMKDILPKEMEIRNYVMNMIRETYGTFGFSSIETPCVEHIENLSSKQGGENEKLIFKILTAPIALAIDLFTLVCIGLISFSAFFLRLASGIVGILGILVLATYSLKNGLILLTIAFLVSPMGLPMLAVWVLERLQSISCILKEI